MTNNGRFQLDKSAGKIAGVCAGIANHTGIDVLWVRVAAVAATLLGSGLPIIGYLVIAVLAQPKSQSLAD
jgi:phage shock protein C